MLTSLKIKNFKRFEDATIELGNPVVFIGPNNSGKTTALQALALWDAGRRAWLMKRKIDESPEKRPGVTINRKDLVAIPVPVTNLLWHQKHVRRGRNDNGQRKTSNIRVDIEISGITEGKEWSCGFEFDYANDESFLCRPLRLAGHLDSPVKQAKFSPVPPQVQDIRVAFLPPMSGLISEEPKWEPGRVNVLLGEGQTAQVLRNLCHALLVDKPDEWHKIVDLINRLFGVTLNPPVHVQERGEITMDYSERGITLDLSSAGRGLQQTLLIAAHLYRNPGTVLLLDEPDAHLEILRQRQVFNEICDIARDSKSQVIAASHSEVVLQEAADTSSVVAFVGNQPHRINDKGSQLLKSLRDIGWDDYYKAETTGWVLYLEGETDHLILQKFAKLLEHPAERILAQAFIKPIGTNIPKLARQHFQGLREAKQNLRGLSIFDQIDSVLESSENYKEIAWSRREIENYFCNRDVFLRYATGKRPRNLFSGKREKQMQSSIEKFEAAFELTDEMLPWDDCVKVSEKVIPQLLRLFHHALDERVSLCKRDYCELVDLLNRDEVHPEIINALDLIHACASP